MAIVRDSKYPELPAWLLRSFLESVDDVGNEVTQSLGDVRIPVWLTVLAVSATVYELVRIQLRHRRATVAVAANSASNQATPALHPMEADDAN